VDKQELQLFAGDAGVVVVANTAPGDMEVKVFTVPDGIEAKLDKTTLKANEKTVLKINTEKDARAGVVQLRVEQTGQLIPIQIKLK
jgi:hypothetical protein